MVVWDLWSITTLRVRWLLTKSIIYYITTSAQSHQTILVGHVYIVNAGFSCIFFVQYENKTFPLWPCPTLGVWPVGVAQNVVHVDQVTVWSYCKQQHLCPVHCKKV